MGSLVKAKRAAGAVGLVLAMACPMAARAAAACKLEPIAELPVTMVGARPTVPVTLNGKAVRFLVATGAFFSLITTDAAAQAGLKTADDFRLRNGVVGVGGRADAKVTHVASFGLASVPLHNVDLVVVDGVGSDVAGVIGENILGNFDVEYDLADGVVRIFRPQACRDNDLAYWAGGADSILALIVNAVDANHHIRAAGTLNGQPITVNFDTGASRSMLTMKAAARAGVTPQTPGAASGGQAGGIGRRLADTWIARFDSLKLGREDIQHPPLRFGSIELDDADMLLGADFFLSHRVYVANSQGRLYFTFNGGHVFQLDKPATTQAAAEGAKTPAQPSGPPDPNAPTDAAGFARRGAAFMARLDYARALDDYGRAIALQPANPDYYVQRAAIHRADSQPALAMADLDKALVLKPDDAVARWERARLYADTDDTARAKGDLDLARATQDARIGARVAGLYTQLGFYDNALAQADAWIAGHPDGADMVGVLNTRCWTRALARRDLDKALADCNAALKLNPKAASILDSRGRVHLERGELNAAIADYDASLTLRPGWAATLYARGIAKRRTGLTAAGDADIAAAKTIAPKIAEQSKRIGLTP